MIFQLPLSSLLLHDNIFYTMVRKDLCSTSGTACLFFMRSGTGRSYWTTSFPLCYVYPDLATAIRGENYGQKQWFSLMYSSPLNSRSAVVSARLLSATPLSPVPTECFRQHWDICESCLLLVRWCFYIWLLHCYGMFLLKVFLQSCKRFVTFFLITQDIHQRAHYYIDCLQTKVRE